MWSNDPASLDFEGKDSDLVEEFIFQGVRKNQAKNREIAEMFGVIVTHVKAFPTENAGWMIIDKHTKWMLHKDLKNKNEVDELCKKHGYIIVNKIK